MRAPRRAALVCALLIAAAAAPADAKRKGRFGRLKVLSMTSGADIFLDGKRAGSVPRERPFTLPAGQHTLRVELRGYTPLEKQVAIKAGKTIEIEADLLAFAGVLLVETAGVTAEVVIDGQPQGPTPFDADVTIGSRSIEVRAPGRIPYKTQLIIKGGQIYPLSVDLEVDPNAPRPPVAATGDAGGDDAGGGFDLGLPDDWYKSPWVLIGAGAAVVVAVGAAVVMSADEEAPAGPTAEQTLPVGAGYR